ncbi:hypothetical protein KY289_037097 [Solanum tuberosum]|nr:hypothetical protein KY289_037097 [Solanum tuberosum]
MKLALLTKNKIRFIDGSITREKFGIDLVNQWDRGNAMVISWIMSNVSKGLLSGILFRSTASSVWEDLRERFNKINLPQVYHLHKEIATLVQGTLPVSVYYSRLKDLWDEYDSIVPPPSCDCAKSREYSENLQKQRLLQFLMGLNDGYSNARG